jgi:hypothetical protein
MIFDKKVLFFALYFKHLSLSLLEQLLERIESQFEWRNTYDQLVLGAQNKTHFQRVFLSRLNNTRECSLQA